LERRNGNNRDHPGAVTPSATPFDVVDHYNSCFNLGADQAAGN
jgi:hypothetical protein